MKIAVYTPYLDSFGGGERYMLTVAECLSVEHRVDLLFDEHLFSLNPEKLKKNLEVRFHLDLSWVNLIQAPLSKRGNFFKKIFFFKKYDLLFYLTDGSLFYSTAKKNIIHFQVPFKNTAAKDFWGRIKLSSWNLAVCNSMFTENEIKKEWGIKTSVLYPPVSVEEIKPLKKKKMILSVGRFNSFLKSKKHEILIQAFSDLSKDNKLKGWSLHLAGSVEGDKKYLEDLKSMTGNLAIFFYPDSPFKDLMQLYGESSIYWHAAGFGEDNPVKMEHFGITTVEAMAGGCVPVVINKGGQPEIVEDGKTGFLWSTTDELKKITLKLIDDSRLLKKMSIDARKSSQLFSKENFVAQIKKIIA